MTKEEEETLKLCTIQTYTQNGNKYQRIRRTFPKKKFPQKQFHFQYNILKKIHTNLTRRDCFSNQIITIGNIILIVNKISMSNKQ